VAERTEIVPLPAFNAEDDMNNIEKRRKNMAGWNNQKIKEGI